MVPIYSTVLELDKDSTRKSIASEAISLVIFFKFVYEMTFMRLGIPLFRKNSMIGNFLQNWFAIVTFSIILSFLGRALYKQYDGYFIRCDCGYQVKVTNRELRSESYDKRFTNREVRKWELRNESYDLKVTNRELRSESYC